MQFKVVTAMLAIAGGINAQTVTFTNFSPNPSQAARVTSDLQSFYSANVQSAQFIKVSVSDTTTYSWPSANPTDIAGAAAFANSLITQTYATDYPTDIANLQKSAGVAIASIINKDLANAAPGTNLDRTVLISGAFLAGTLAFALVM